MAETREFPESNHHYGPPPGREHDCGWIHLWSNGRDTISAWWPTAEELERLNAGEPMFVTVQSGQRTDGAPLVFPMFVGTRPEMNQVVPSFASAKT